jgi:hypothetical protein
VKKSFRLLLPIALAVLISLACTITLGAPAPAGFSQQDRINTAVAQALGAGNPPISTLAPPPQATTAVPVQPPTLTPLSPPTQTPIVPPTQTPLSCNKALFISETIPDGTTFTINHSFTKTWRVKNTGTCTWNTNYKLVFSGGTSMNSPATQNLAGNVGPNEQVDLALSLKAPGSAGSFSGVWKLMADNGEIYTLSGFTLAINVSAPAAPAVPAVPAVPVSHTIALTAISGEGGSIRSDGSVHATLANVGDTNLNISSQSFASFDMTAIPAGAIVQKVKLSFSGYDTLGNPFGGLGCLDMYPQDYGALNAGDYFAGGPLNLVARWCAAGLLASVYTGTESGLVSQVQLKVGSSRFQVRFQFNEHATNSDGVADMVRFGVIRMDVTYYVP